jgi:hypothetical protein
MSSLSVAVVSTYRFRCWLVFTRTRMILCQTRSGGYIWDIICAPPFKAPPILASEQLAPLCTYTLSTRPCLTDTIHTAQCLNHNSSNLSQRYAPVWQYVLRAQTFQTPSTQLIPLVVCRYQDHRARCRYRRLLRGI